MENIRNKKIIHTISSIASLIAVNVNTKQRGTIVVYGGRELICGINFIRGKKCFFLKKKNENDLLVNRVIRENIHWLIDEIVQRDF